jgi:hypothetical protein
MGDAIMDDNARLQLQKMISANNVEDQTQLIRDLKHSVVLQNDINKLILLKMKYRNDVEMLNMEGPIQCQFLFNYYTDIYNKIKKDEIDLSILNQFLNVLRRIENEELDQHEGSFVIGKLLKEMYIDSALKKADKINAQYENEKEEQITPVVDVSWKQFKQMKQ